MGLGITGKSFRQIINDSRFRKSFNSMMSMGDVLNQDAINDTLLTLDLTADDISGSLMKAAQSADKTGISFKAMGVGAQAASVGMKVLATAGNMLATMLISLAVTKAIQGIEYLANYADHMADNLEESKSKVEANETAIADMNKELEETNKLIKELEGLSSLNPIQQEQLDMAKEQRLELERRLAVEQALLRVNQRQKNSDYTKAFNSRISENAGAQSVFDSASNTILQKQFESDSKAHGVDSTFAKDIALFDASGSGTMGTLGYTNAGRFEANKLLYKQNLEEIKKLRQDTFDAEDKGLDDAIAEYDKKIAKLEEENATLISNMSEYVKELQTAAEGISYIEGDHLTTQEKATNDRLDYTSYVGESFADLENTARAQADFEAVFESEVFSEQAKKLEELAKAGELTAQALSAEEFGGIMAEWEKLGWTAEQVAKQINDSIGNAPDAPKSSASSLYASLFKNTEAYTKLTEAMNEQNEAGTLSFETYTALIEANSEFAELLTLTAEGYVLNTEAVWEYVEAQDEFNKLKAMVELEKINEQLLNSADLSRDEVDALMAQKAGWEQVITSITSATGALQAWKQAQASANKDAAFNEGESMYDTITEGLKTGKVGTDDFQRSIDFMLGENWLRDYRGDKDAAYKAAQQKAKRYFGQEDERIGMQNFMEDLDKHGFAEYDGKDFKLLEDVNIEGVADKLGMSVDAIKSMFGLMETYGAELKYAVDTSELTDQDRKRVENANSIEEIRKAQAEVTAEIEHQQSILSDTSATEAQKQAAQEEINNLNTANEVLEEKKGILEGVEGAAQALTLDEALSKITELQTAINTLVEAGIDVPVEITGQYDDLTTLISQLGGQAVGANGEVQGFVLHVSDPDDAAGKIKALQEAIAAVQANPNISANLKAEFVGAAETAVDKLQGVVDSNGRDVIIHLIPDDQATTAIDGVTTGPEGGWNATITAKAKTDDADTALTNFVNKERTAYIKVVPDSTVDLEEGETIESKVEGTGFAATKQDNGSYKWTDPISYFNGVVNKLATETGKTPSQDSVMAQYEQDVANGLVAFGEATHNATELISSALQIFTENAWANGPDGGVAGTETGGIDGSSIKINEVEVESAAVESATEIVQEEFDSNPIDTKVEVDGENIQEEVKEATSETGTVEVEVQPDVQPMPSLGEMGIPSETEFALGADTSTGQAQVDALKTSAETPVQTPVSLNTATADSQNSSLVSRLRQTVTKTVRIVYTGIRSKFATGTKNAPGGLSLVDDGTGSNAGPELIVHNKQGTYELGSGDGPRVTHLDKGDTVYTAKQTKSILAKAAKIGGFFRDGLNNARTIIGNAFATGVSGSMSWKKINASLSNKSGSSKKNTSSSNNDRNWTRYTEQLFDWIEIRLERLQVQTEKWMLAASEAIGFIAKNNELDKALTSTSQQIDETTQAYQRYIEQANTVAAKTALSADIIAKIQDGSIDIVNYNDDTKKKIEQYQEWWDKAEGCVEALTELREQERELATQKLDSILDHYQWRIDRLDAVVSSNDAMIGLKAATGIRIEESDYADSIDATNQKIQELTASRAALADEFADMIQRGYIVEGSELWYEYTGELENLDETIIETKTDLQDLIDSANNVALTNLQYAMNTLESAAATINQMMGLHEAQGSDHNDSDYESLIQNGMAQIKNLEAQNAELLKQQNTLDSMSEKYQELQEQIDSNNQSILDMKTSQEQWNDAVLDLKVAELEKFKNQLSKTNDEYQRELDLQQAIEDLERAKSQRTQRVFRDGVGFVFEADQDAILDSQRNLESVIQGQLLDKIDDLIEALGESKADTNVYDANGILLGTEYTLPNIGNYSELLNNYLSSNDVVSSAMEDARKAAYEQVLKGVTSNSSIKSIQIGDIVVQGVDNAEDLATAIVDNFPNALLQELYK